MRRRDMASETANQKRKRGRPTNASREDGTPDASNHQSTLTHDMKLTKGTKRGEPPQTEDNLRPKKRGRPAKPDGAPKPEVADSTAEPRKRKRGEAPAATVDNEMEESNAKPAKGPEKSQKRGRPAKGTEPVKEPDAAEEDADDENEGNSSLLRRSGRTRRSPGEQSKEDQRDVGRGTQKMEKQRRKGRPPPKPESKDVGGEESGPNPKSKRGRPAQDTHGASEAVAEPKAQPQTTKRKRPSPLAMEAESAAAPKQRRGRRKASPEPEEEDQQAEEKAPRRSRPKRADEPEPAGRTKKSKRSSKEPAESAARSASPESDSAPPAAAYQHLTTRTRRVPRHTIESKWSPLEPSSITSVGNLLHSAARPVLLRLNNLQRHSYASAALSGVSNRLRSKLLRGQPFPPATTAGTRDGEVDFERTVAGVEALQAQLDPLLHGVALLRRERERAQRELERDYRRLRTLETNERAEARQKRDQARHIHVLVPERAGEGAKEEEEGGDGGLLPRDKGAGLVFRDEDEELKATATQIGSHMESMRGNLEQIEGVVPAIARSRALLRNVLQPRLDREQLENLVLN
ncbi:CENP-Q, a CENPA-CAD centromere complex subunit-domain-containing protein [Xylariomycetidae sp. FL0641]|nr:CENP-Q, a CENPA-CAD centromere complex subunit-domain-containing protein [Xylariomycetidae sp. FL0641]